MNSMAIKLIIVAALISIAQAGAPNYEFGYGVSDPLTGDSKTQQETRVGDVVQGSYSLIDSDGTQRIVQYTADAINGFNAVVSKQPLGGKVIAQAAAPALAYGAVPTYASHSIAAPYSAPAISYGLPGYSHLGAGYVSHSYSTPSYGYNSLPTYSKLASPYLSYASAPAYSKWA